MGKGIILQGGCSSNLDIITAKAKDIRSGKIIIDSNGDPLTGTMPEQASITITPEIYDRTIAVSGKYMTGNITVLGTGIIDNNPSRFETVSSNLCILQSYPTNFTIDKVFIVFEVSDPDGHLIPYTARLKGTETTVVTVTFGVYWNYTFQFKINDMSAESIILEAFCDSTVEIFVTNIVTFFSTV